MIAPWIIMDFWIGLTVEMWTVASIRAVGSLYRI